MKRDKKGRFSKEEDDKEGFNLNITLPSFKTILFWLFLLILLLSWTVIFAKFKIFKKVFDFFENIMSKGEEEETPKKNGLFY